MQVATGNRVKGWMLGTVTNVIGDLMSIEFRDSIIEYDKNVDRWSTNLAPAGSKTAEDYEWRKENLEGCIDYEIDAHDGDKWFKATILETRKEFAADGREIEEGYIAFRVYRTFPATAKRPKQDEKGTFEGWSAKYDEWMPLYSPKIR